MFIKKPVIIILCLISIVISLPLYSAETENQEESIKKMDRQFVLRTGFSYSSLDFDLCYTKYNGKNVKEVGTVEYMNNSTMNMRTGIGYRDVVFFVAIPVPETEESRNRYGKTDYRDFQLSWYPGTMVIDLYLQRYKGFYIDNTGISEEERIRPDITLLNTGFNMLYCFAGEYSFKSSYFQTERQENTNAGGLLMVTANYCRIGSNRSMLPESVEEKYGNDAGYKGGSYYTAGIGPGLGITLIPFQIFDFSKVYISSTICIGYGVVYKEYETSLKMKKDTAGFCFVNWRASTGFNGDWIFWGAAFSIDCRNTRLIGSGIDVTTYPGYIEFFLGTRI